LSYKSVILIYLVLLFAAVMLITLSLEKMRQGARDLCGNLFLPDVAVMPEIAKCYTYAIFET